MQQEMNKELMEEFIKTFGDENIPSPEHNPKQYEFLVKMFLYQRSRKSTELVKV